MLFCEPARSDQIGMEFPHHLPVNVGCRFLPTRVGHPRQNVPNDIQTSLMLVIGSHDNPGPFFMFSASQQRIPSPTVLTPRSLGRLVDGAEFPLLQWILPPLLQPPRLLPPADVQIVFEENDP